MDPEERKVRQKRRATLDIHSRHMTDTPWVEAEKEIEDEYQKMVRHKADGQIYANPNTAAKNRYQNVLPIEKTRVILEKSEGSDSDQDDYINANYINRDEPDDPELKKVGPQQQYICCQAPLTNTVADFWLMIWQENVPVIVMLTNLEEKSRVKADQYWPENKDQPEIAGKIEVTLAKTFPHTGFVVRQFMLRKKKHSHWLPEERTVYQLHYTEWPDFGAPESTEEMTELLRELDIRKKGLDDPIVVHCSAGIGRTGTFLAIHLTLQQVNASKSPPEQLDVMKTVLSLRAQRHGMIQSKEQYKFVYATVRDVMAQRIGFEGHAPLPRRSASITVVKTEKAEANELVRQNRVLSKSLKQIIPSEKSEESDSDGVLEINDDSSEEGNPWKKQ